MADLEHERLAKKEEKRQKKAEELAKKQESREKKQAKEREEERIALRTCADLMEQLDICGDVVFETMKVTELKMLIRYQFKSDKYKEKGIKKMQLKAIAMRLYEEHF